MAFDIYSTPAMSDEPERVFSIAGNNMNPRRRCLTSDATQQLMCLRSWQRSEVITLDKRLIRQAVLSKYDGGIGGDGIDGIGGIHDIDDIDGDSNGGIHGGGDLHLFNNGELLYHEHE